MDAFAYLSVLISIILGLAIAEVLQAYRRLLLARARVRLYPPPLILSALMLVFATQSWWASFGLAAHRDWDFATFALILLQVGIIYMMAAIVLPDSAAGEAIDLRAHYERERRPFFILALAMLAVSIGKDLMIDHRLPEGRNLAFHLVFAAAALAAILIRRPRFHAFLAPAMAALVAVYIFLLFARL